MKRKTTKAIFILSLLLFVCSQNVVFAVVITSAQSGLFSVGSTWVGGVAPAVNDDIIISTGHTVTLDINATVYNITINPGSVLDNGSFNLIVGAGLTAGNPVYINNGVHNSTTGNLIGFENGSIELSGNGISNCNFVIRAFGFKILSSCNLTINGNFQPVVPGNTGMMGNAILEAWEGGGGNLTINGDIITDPLYGGSILNHTGTIIVNGNVSLLGGSESGSGSVLENYVTLNISGNLTLGPWSSYCQNVGNMIIGGDLLGGGLGDTYFWQETGATVKFGGSVFADPTGGLFFANSSAMGGTTEPSTIEYNGTVVQNIALPFDGFYSNLVINNSSSTGVTLATDITVNGALALTNGLVNLGSSNLILNDLASISGTPSATSMVVATGTGELRKTFTAAGSFTYPVGDNDGTAEYSPVTLNFTSGSFGGAYAGVNLLNSAYTGVTGSYLNRNWTVSSVGITGFTCDATFNYVAPADVVGTESSIYCFRVAPTTDLYDATNTTLHQLSATGLTSFGTFTGKQQENTSPVTSTWTGATNSEWFTAGNWTDGVPGATTLVTIPGALTNYPTLLSATTISSITINDGGSFIGSEFLTTGSALVKRDIINSNFHFVSSPVASTSFGSVFPLNQTEVWAREYNETTGNWDNLTIADFLSVGKGYSVQMNQPQTALFAGVLNSSPITLTLAKQNPGVDPSRVGWNLLGNPFTSAIDWDLTDHSAIDGSVYAWNGTQYVSWNGGIGALTDGIIPAENGFFARTTVDAATLSIPLASRVHSSAGYYKSTLANVLELTAEGNGNSDKTFIHFNDQASADFDNQFDAYKLTGIADAPQLYSTTTAGKLSINELPLSGNEVVALGFSSNTEGIYTLQASGTENFASSVPVYLKDILLNVIQDLKINPVYSFSYQPGETENRFELIFLETTGVNEAQNMGISIFSFDNTTVIGNAGLLTGTISISDITGRKLHIEKLNAQAETRIQLKVGTGIYLVQVQTENGSVSAKVFIR